MDPFSATLTTFGVIILLASWIQLLFTSFRKDYAWGLTSVFAPPLSYVYCFYNFEESKDILSLSAIGFVLLILGLA